MKSGIVCLFACLSAATAFAQSNPMSATVPFHPDHNRIIVEVSIPLPDGTNKQVCAWVDNGDPSLNITRHLAKVLGLRLPDKPGNGGDAAARIHSVYLGKMRIDLSQTPITEILPGMASLGVEMNIPSAVLRNYGFIVDYPGRMLTIATPGGGRFEGKKVVALINADNGLVQIPGIVDGHPYNLALDMGTPVCFISDQLLSEWQRAHVAWPHTVGAISIANLWGLDGEPLCDLLRIPEMSYGGLTLSDVIAVSFDKSRFDYFERRAGVPTIGLIGADALLNYRVGIDYAHSAVYFERVGDQAPTHLDVVGLILRPGEDGRYGIIGVANIGGKPAVDAVKAGDILAAIDNKRVTGLTMGSVWSMLKGNPGSVRVLRINREGRTFRIKAKVYRFL
jgi:hypothetical protein